MIDTDTFRAIFRNAVRTTHAGLLEGVGVEAGVNLSDSVSILAGTLQLPSSAGATSAVQPSGFATSFADITQRLGRLDVWRLDDTITRSPSSRSVWPCRRHAALLVSIDRRRAAWWLGWTVTAVGAFTAGLLHVSGWYVERRFGGEVGAALAARSAR